MSDPVACRRATLAEHHALLLKVLCEFDRFCTEHDIEYSLAYGTLLGAVRHQGFIPWDDDVDLFMTVKAYAKFRTLWAEKKDQYPHLHLWDFYSHYNHYTGYLAKFYTDEASLVEPMRSHTLRYGPYLDIFVVVNLPEESSECHRYFRRLRRMRYWMQRINHRLYKAKPSLEQNGLQRRFHRLNERYMDQPSSQMGIACCATRHDPEPMAPAACFTDLVRVPFEGVLLPIAKDADTLLRGYYGPDYMTPPPEDQRGGHDSQLWVFEDDHV